MIKHQYSRYLKNFTFIDLFCGIGAFRLALESFGAKCVFSSDINKDVQKTYRKNFGDKPTGDITKVKETDIPNHDMLCAGFPCQAFSIRGHRLGFNEARGTLFFDIIRIAKCKKPKVLLLENVVGLINHEDGKTYDTILNTLNDIGYDVFTEVLNAVYYGVPQHRKRIFFVCFRKDLKIKNFTFPEKTNIFVTVEDILEHDINKLKGKCKIFPDSKWVVYKRIPLKNRNGHYARKIMSTGHSIVNGRKGRGISAVVFNIKGVATAQLASKRSVDTASTGVFVTDNGIRSLTPRESIRLMGFPDSYIIRKNKRIAIEQSGNSIVVNVLQYIILSIIEQKII